MSDRDLRLLPRLLGCLDTLETDAEIIATVRRIQATFPGHFTRLANLFDAGIGDVCLDYGDREMNIRLRGLGIMLRLVSYPDPVVQAALLRTREAMIVLGNVNPRDLVITLACLRDVILRESERRFDGEGLRILPARRDTQVRANPLSMDVRHSLDALYQEMRRPV
jgi:hypothetical protein